MKKRILSLCMALALCLTLLPVTALAADVTYIERIWNSSTNEVTNETKTISDGDYTVIDSGTTAWGTANMTTWYVVNSTFTITQRVTVTGDVRLILTDDCELTVNGGIQVQDSSNSLTIYAQSDGAAMGRLTAASYGRDAGIGGSRGQTAGAVTIHGGTVNASSSSGGAGIGGGYGGGSGGTVTIYGGTVTASSSNDGAGIGGGGSVGGGGSGDTVTIHGGTVTASSSYGAGIGGGYGSMGSGGSGGQVTIHGGTVTASSSYGAGIGGGSAPAGGIGGAGSFSTGANGNAVIFASSSIASKHIQDQSGADDDLWQGVIFQGNSGQVYGAVTLEQDLTIESGKTLTIPAGVTLTIPAGVTLTIPAGVTLTVDEGGTISNQGTINVWGTFINHGTLEGKPPIYKVTGVTLDKTELSLTAGRRAALTATVAPENATDQNITWASSNSGVATVEANGGDSATVTAVGAGTAKITVTADGGYTASCTVTVEPAPASDDDSDPTYAVTLPDKATGGEISVKKRYAQEGETFRFTVTPDEGWDLDALAVTDSRGTELTLTREGGGTYSFTMPARQVSIGVSFRKTAAPLPFTDVAESYWARDEIAWAYESGYMSGTAATTFHPGGTVSRQQVWMILARMAGAKPSDMAEAKAWAVANGISDGTNPGAPVTRQQLAALLYRYAVLAGYDVSVGEDTNILSYTDVGQLSEHAIPAMQWACGAGIIRGTGDGSTLTPQGASTRAQLAVMLYRWLA